MPHDAHVVDYRTIFAPSTPAVQQANFTQCWQFMQQQDGTLLEAERDLAKKRQRLQAFQAQPVRSRQPFPDLTMCVRNALVMRDDPATLPRPLRCRGLFYPVWYFG